MTAKIMAYDAKHQPRLYGMRASVKAVEVLVRREWLKVLKEPSRAVGIVVQPLLFWWVIGSGFVPSFKGEGAGGLNYQTYFFPGILALVLLFSAIFSMITLIDDRNSGFMQAVLVSPSSRLSVVFGKVLGSLSIALVQVLLFLPLMPLAHIDAALVNWPLFVLYAFASALFFTSLGFVMAWLSPSTAAFHALMSIILLPMWILSGAMFPLEGTWMAPLLQINPAAFVVKGFQHALLGAEAGPEIVLKLIVLSALALGAGVYACYRNR